MAMKIKTEIIENYRKDNHLTVTAFCKKCGIAQQTYYRIMHGHTDIRLSATIKILKTINVLCADIVDFND